MFTIGLLYMTNEAHTRLGITFMALIYVIMIVNRSLHFFCKDAVNCFSDDECRSPAGPALGRWQSSSFLLPPMNRVVTPSYISCKMPCASIFDKSFCIIFHLQNLPFYFLPAFSLFAHILIIMHITALYVKFLA